MLSDILDVQISIAPGAAALPSFGKCCLMHTLTEAQVAAMGSARSVTLTPDTWAAQLTALGITSGEAAYNDVRALFSQSRKPSQALLARRGKPRAQVWTIQVPASPTNGVYAIHVAGATGTPYSFTASSSTQSAVQTGLLSALAAGSAKFTAADGGSGAITLTGVTAGEALIVTLSSPSSSMTGSVTTSIVNVVISQVWTMTIPSATLGLYTLTVQTSTGQKTYSHIATTGATTTTIRDAIKAAYDADPSDLFETTMSTSGSTIGRLTASFAGRPGVVSLTAPGSATVAVTTANWGMPEDIDALIDQDNTWYVLLPGSHSDGVLSSTAEKIETLEKLCIMQTSTDAVKTSATTDFASILKGKKYERSAVIWHNSDADGVHASWAGYVTTLKAGAVQWSNRQLIGFTPPALTASEQVALRSKEVSFIDNFPALGVAVVNGGYNFAGRPIDIIRAVDTFRADVRSSLLTFLSSNDIVPYTNAGIDSIIAVINTVWERALADGYAVPNSLKINQPKISDATSIQRQRGEVPLITATATFQAGVHKLSINMKVVQ